MVKAALQVLTPLPLTEREDGRLILNLWKKSLPKLLPDRFGNSEPLEHHFDSENIEFALDSWKRPFLAAQKKWSMESNIWARKGNQQLHATWVFSFDFGAASQSELTLFLKAASVELKADFACLHLLTVPEVERGRASKVVFPLNKQATRFGFFISSNDLQNRIPDVFWLTVLGSPYVKLFGHERLLSAPAHRKELLTADSVVLQLSESMTDIENHPNEIDRSRSAIQAHLGQEAFFQPERPLEYKYSVPTFHFSSGTELSELVKVGTDKSKDSTLFSEGKQATFEPCPEIQQMAAKYAFEAIDLARTRFGIRLDFSEHSIRDVETILEKLHKQMQEAKLSKDQVLQLAAIFGSYVGEVLRRRHRADWGTVTSGVSRLPGMRLQPGMEQVMPWSKAQKRIVNGGLDSMWQYFQVISTKSPTRKQ